MKYHYCGCKSKCKCQNETIFYAFFYLFKQYLLKIFLISLPVLHSCFLSNLPKSLKGLLYTSVIAPFIIFGAMFSTRCPPWFLICCMRLCAIWLTWPVAYFIILGANASRPIRSSDLPCLPLHKQNPIDLKTLSSGVFYIFYIVFSYSSCHFSFDVFIQ